MTALHRLSLRPCVTLAVRLGQSVISPPTVSPLSVNMATLETLSFDNLALRELPIDAEKQNFVRQVSGACFSLVEPDGVENPRLVLHSGSAMALLDLPESEIRRPELVQYMSGNQVLPGARPAAHCYCGHQFGYFSGQLGDGAAMYLGEVVNQQGQRWEIQLKGAGKTPYSRSADGRKVLRSSIREFLCSEAMHHLGIPTSRAGTCVTSDTTVTRDIFYTGNPVQERATIVLRIAQTFIRFGSFEIFKPIDVKSGRRGPSVGKKDILEKLTKYVIKTFYPEIWEEATTDEIRYLEFFKEVTLRTARLVAHWQAVGWCHGVLNTDNMSIVGLTIDYGPFGFIDTYEPGFICNGSDEGGRYAFDRQAEVCKWNLAKLAEALAPIVAKEKTQPLLDLYDGEFHKHYHQLLMKKFGLSKMMPEDKQLFQQFHDAMATTGADFTNSFRCLSHLTLPGSQQFDLARSEVKATLLAQCCPLEEMKRAAAPKMEDREFQMMLMLLNLQPEILEQIGRGSAALFREMERRERHQQLQELTEEEKRATDSDTWEKWLTLYSERLQAEVPDVGDLTALNQARRTLMDSANPKFILRNYIAQDAIEAAEAGDYTEVRRVLCLLQSPYAEHVDLSDTLAAMQLDQGGSEVDPGGQQENYSGRYCRRAPASALGLRVT